MNKSIIGVLVLALFVLWRTFTAGYEKADTTWRLKWSQRDSADAAARAAVEAENKGKENARQQEIAKAAQQAEQNLQDARADAVAAGAVSQCLQQSVVELQRKLKRSNADLDTAIAAEREAEARAAILFAELFRGADGRAGELAAEADESRIRGLACEAAYAALESSQ